MLSALRGQGLCGLSRLRCTFPWPLFLRLRVSHKQVFLKFFSLMAHVTRHTQFDVSGDFMSKRHFLHHCDIPESPFAVGALNTLSAEDKVEFFTFFSSILNFNTYDRKKLIQCEGPPIAPPACCFHSCMTGRARQSPSHLRTKIIAGD
jgi:hypothetical protein